MNDDENVEKIEQVKPDEQDNQGAVTNEGAAASPETNEVAKMYEELGIKASVPTDKPKGRPKTSKVRTEKPDEKGTEDSSDGKSGNQDDKDKSKDAPASDDNGDSGDNPDSKGKEVSKDSKKVSDKPEEADDGVRQAESRDEGDSKRGSEEDTDQGADRAGQEDDQSQDQEGEGEDTEVKRPGKSNPEIERRFQRLTEEKRERDQRIAELERQLQETSQQYQQAQVAQEDPEYTIDDFRRVRDDEGNIIDLDEERAELAWRRWKDGYDQRAAERQAEAQRQQTMEQYQQAIEQRLMEKSVEAYDTLTSLADEYPELNENSPKFDQELSAEVMPIIKKMVEYQEGTEPGNPQGLQPVITGMKMNPGDILSVINRIRQAKRSLPLNGIDDNVESRSNVNVPHSRSSDPTIRAANDLYKELGINKRL